ncbi:MAG TPA: (2Fe-2S)-binding protein [Chloroflexota bacterium]|nr:(2Fe-2S)-binding protein [Chloroflexota bacterium]
MSKQILHLTVNGEDREILVQPYQTLLEVLRDEIGLTGAKEGCGTGDCGCCTVLLDGKPVTSCLVVGLQADGHQVTTVEGLESDDGLDPIQQAFVRRGALQCGFCIPGAVVMARALLNENPNPTEAEIRWAMAGNLCRCTGYTKWIEAIQDVVQEVKA